MSIIARGRLCRTWSNAGSIAAPWRGFRTGAVPGIMLAAIGSLATFGTALAQTPSTHFVYQGRLESGGVTAFGLYDLRFTLFSAATGGTALTPPFCVDDVLVTGGLFTTDVGLLIPPGAGEAFLQVEARADTGLSCGTPTGFSAMLPRSRLAPAPRSVYAMAASPKSPMIPGAIRFNSDSGALEVSDGALWYPVTLGAALAPTSITDIISVGPQAFIVPAGVTRLTVDMWGGGGGGGGAGPGLPAPTSGACNAGTAGYSAGGGGGASGSVGRFAFNVTPGESLTVFVGEGGVFGSTGQNGAKGGTSFIRRGATDLVIAPGGFGGQGGPTSTMSLGSGSCGSAPIAGLGGVPDAAASAPAPAQTVSATTGAVGGPGRRPVCFGVPFGSTTWCPAVGGPAAGGMSFGAPLSILAAGGGGTGGSPSSVAQPGQPGRVRIFWY